MVHWAWVMISLMIGVVAGMFIIALAEVSKQADEKNKKWWDDNGKL